MTKINEIYKCEICGNIVELVHESTGELVCCGQKMKLMNENTIDASIEKHIPIILEQKENKIIVQVGEIEHPMTNEHYIEWIEVITKNSTHKIFLKPNEKPKAEFLIQDEILNIREYCNLHGLWKNEINK